MNRTTALLLALALLLAHTLAMYHDASGGVLAPGDAAHAAYRSARNLVHLGSTAFNPGAPRYEPYPSTSLVVVAAIAERLTLRVTTFCQVFGIGCALLTVVATSTLSRKRLAGVIGPALLVVNGGLATVAADGSEGALFALTLVSSFLAFQLRALGALVGLLVLAFATRPEALIYLFALALLELLRRARPRPGERSALGALGFAAALCAGLHALRMAYGASAVPPDLLAVLRPSGERTLLGLEYTWDAARTTTTPLLVLLPLACVLSGRFSRLGNESLALALCGAAIVCLQGGSEQPFGAALVPCLPLLFVAVQEALVLLLDSRRRLMEPLAWVLLVVTGASSVFASKLPGHFGTATPGGALARWNSPGPLSEQAYGRSLGRAGLDESLSDTRRLRALGHFLREQTTPTTTILTPWPGAIGYLSRRHVHDMLGRVTPLARGARPRPWSGPARGDLLASMQLAPDYVLPSCAALERPFDRRELAARMLARFDALGPLPERVAALEHAIADYDLITVPVPLDERLESPAGQPLLLLRARRLGQGPGLSFLSDGRAFAVELRHSGPHQLAELVVQFESENGHSYGMRPTGRFERDGRSSTRAELLLCKTGSRPIEVVRGEVPSGLGRGTLRAELRNPLEGREREGPALCAPIELRIE